MAKGGRIYGKETICNTGAGRRDRQDLSNPILSV